ncbi:type II 3-dehydroquinate dehydratase [Alicyclobacillus fastidiosus]|uniref:3-dehydroquinate dehydratase n=1 Tax=Alicyclobacillus fastidiosus TaxID=392011 RepID=A0ABV5AG26_9BACL|nr:type II 3-dehydroquinate dehydratase [Alicyclobacillus fastidiosus]WEH11704.1 3-dehydroquinate dehydratase [Alicyclobacillus fastidiosus]
MDKPYLVVIHGPNLNRLGVRKPETYGHRTLADVIALVKSVADGYGLDVLDKQSNHEGDLIDFLQMYGPDAAGILINPGAFGHYSYGLRDCLEDIDRPTIEVHISNVHKREAFRHQLVLADVVMGQVVGLGTEGYRFAADALCRQYQHDTAKLR